MAAPNIVNVTTIIGKTAVQQVTTSATAIVTNSSSSNKVFKINALYVANVDGTNNADISVALFRSSVSYEIAHTVFNYAIYCPFTTLVVGGSGCTCALFLGSVYCATRVGTRDCGGQPQPGKCASATASYLCE